MEVHIATALEAAESQFREALERRNRQLEAIKSGIITLAEETSRCGIFADEMRTLIGLKRFDVWFVQQRFACTLDAAKPFIKFAQRRETLSEGFKRTLLALPGLVEVQERADGSQHKLPKTGCRWISALMKAIGELNAAREQSPIEDLPETHRITLMDSLRPLVELHHELEGLCEE